MQTACEYKKNTKRKEEEKNCDLKFETKEIFYIIQLIIQKANTLNTKAAFIRKKQHTEKIRMQKKTQLF